MTDGTRYTNECRQANAQHCENYHLYFISIKPNFRSYKKLCIGNNAVMCDVLGDFMREFNKELKWVDGCFEYDSKNVCHLHMVLTSKIDILKLYPTRGGLSMDRIKNFKKGFYVDFRIVDPVELDYVISYINKVDKTHEVMNYYRYNYGFV